MNLFAKGALAALTLAAAAAVPGIANAANAYTTGDVNMRTGPGVGYARILVVPANSALDIYGCTGNWCQGSYAGYQGWISASYLASLPEPPAYAPVRPPVYPMPMPMPYPHPQPEIQLEFNFGGSHPPRPPHLNGWGNWGPWGPGPWSH